MTPKRDAGLVETTGVAKAGIAALVAAAAVLASCAGELPPRSYVQTNVVDKALFEGEWYYSWTVIDNRYASTSNELVGTYVGDTSMDFGAGWTVARIRWVIDEDYLYAFRAHELVRGANPDADDGNWDADGDGEADGYRGEPVAAFAVESHFDIRRSYNPTTGEEMNVIEENSQDNRWYERRFMRVDWSVNHIYSYQNLNQLIMDYYQAYGIDPGHMEPVQMFLQPGSDVPDNWFPSFDFTPEERPCDADAAVPSECSYRDAYMSRFWDEHGPNQIYHMSFVTQEMMSPGRIYDPYSGGETLFCQSIYSDSPLCTSSIITKRHSFLRLSPQHDYAPTLHEDLDFDRFGLFRIERPTYDRVDPENPADPRLGRTDFLDYYSVLHNIWSRHHDEEGNVLPLTERDPQALHVWLTAGYPPYLIRTAMSNAGEWGEAFMRAVRINQERELPDQYYRDSACTANQDCLDAYGVDSMWRTTCDQAVGRCRRPYNPYRSPESPHFYENDFDCFIGLPGGQPAHPDPLGSTPHDPDNPSSPAETLSDFDPDLNLVFNGSECMLVAHVNSCDVDPALPCEERGDMRYRFFSFVYSADTPFLGVATMRGDPVTGEMASGDANVAYWDIGWYRTRALQEYDILTGNLTEEQLMTGEDVRGMIDDLGRLIPPVRPLRDEVGSMENELELPAGFDRDTIDERWGRAMARAERLRGEQGRQAIYSDRRYNLAGTEVESMLFDNVETLIRAGVTNFTEEVLSSPVPEEIMDRVSPMRTRLADRAEMLERREINAARAGRCYGMGQSSFTDYSVLRFVQDHMGYTRPQLSFALDRHVLSETLLHEYGHVIGLRHNFVGTVDAHNFHPEYHEIVRNHPLPTCTDRDLANGTCVGADPRNMEDDMNYDQNGDGQLSRDEMAFLTRAQANVRRQRELAGIEQYWTSTLMEYTPAWYHRLVGLGKYDIAAVLFNYGGVIEVYNNAGDGALPVDELNSADGERIYWRWYRGGESCEADSDCPYSEGGAMSGDLLADQREVGVYQRCLPNPRYEGGRGVCSDTYRDLEARMSGGMNERVPVRYRFCTDDRVADQSDCNRMDEGASYQEIVQNLRENYHRQYFWNNFRRFRRNFPGSYGYRVEERLLMPLAGIYHHMFYRWATEGEEYRNDAGPLGFYDQYMASVDVLNFLAEVMAQPAVGVYAYWPYTNSYERVDESLAMDPRYWDVAIRPGLGKYMYSDYRTGITGIFYLERLGVITDKWIALDMLTNRDMGLPYTIDEYYYVNFYDAFPDEMSYLMGNFATEQFERVMPRISVDEYGEPVIQYLDLWRGSCDFVAGETCRPDPDGDSGGAAWVDDEAQFYMQFYSAINSLAEFPVYWDANWERELRLYVEGGVDNVAVTDCADAPDDPDCMVEGIDYIRFVSDRFHRSYIAIALEPDHEGRHGQSYMFDMLTRAVEMQDEISRIEACIEANEHDTCGFEADWLRDYELRRARWDLDDIEGFLRYFLQIQRDYGINTWLGY